jgi:conjugal transfer/entry exclusion protein
VLILIGQAFSIVEIKRFSCFQAAGQATSRFSGTMSNILAQHSNHSVIIPTVIQGKSILFSYQRYIY